MKRSVRRWLVVAVAFVALPASAYTLEAWVSGIATDSTGSALPGVTITALHQATGNTFVAVIDETGSSRIPVVRATVAKPGSSAVSG